MDTFRKSVDEIFAEISTIKSILDAGMNPSATPQARLTLELRLVRIQRHLTAAVAAMPLEPSCARKEV